MAGVVFLVRVFCYYLLTGDGIAAFRNSSGSVIYGSNWSLLLAPGFFH